MCQVTRGKPATLLSPGSAPSQEPCQVQTNLLSPHPHLGQALKDTAVPLVTSGFQQQSNLCSPAGWSPRKARGPPVQQQNLCLRATDSLPLRESPGPLAHLSPCLRQVPQAAAAPCPDFRPATGLATLSGCTRSRPQILADLRSRTARLVGEPLTLQDLAVPAQSQAQAPSHTAVHLLLASVERLEHQAARLRGQMFLQPPGFARWGPCASRGQALPARPQPSQPGLASWDDRRHLRSLGARGVQAGLSGARGSAGLFQATSGVFAGDFLDSEQGLLPAQPPGPGEKYPPAPTHGREARGAPSLLREAGSGEARLTSPGFSSAAGDVLAGQEGARASCSPNTSPVRRCAPQSKAQSTVTPDPPAACWQLLSRCFGAWKRLVQRRWAVTAATALSRRRLMRKGLQALRWALWLREAQLEAAQGRCEKALLSRSFRQWRCLALRQQQGQPQVQPMSCPPCQVPSVGRMAVVDAAWRSSPGNPREEEGARPSPLQPGQRAHEGVERVEILQALRQLAVGLLQCHQKDRARQESEVLEEEPRVQRRTWRTASPAQAWYSHAAGALVAPQPQRAWLRSTETQEANQKCKWQPLIKPLAGDLPASQGGAPGPSPRLPPAPTGPQVPAGRGARANTGCFGAWQQLARRGVQYQHQLADRRVGTLRMCLGRWVQMKQLRASDGAKVTQLSLCLKKTGGMALCSPTPGATTTQGLETVAQAQGLLQEPGQGSLQEACQRLTQLRVLRLWRTRLSQHQQANSFSQGVRERTLRCILSWWHLRAWGPDTPSGCSETTSDPKPLGRDLRGEAWLGCRTPRVSLGQAPRALVLVELLQVSFLWAAGQRQQRRCLLLWQARAQRSRGAARWCRRRLQRRVLLSWSHWTTAQRARRELAAHWARDRSCRATLGLWQRRLAQWQKAEQWAQERERELEREALQHWHSCWQRQQFLREKCQRWVQGHLQGLRRAVFQGWRQAAAHRRHRLRVLKAWAPSAAQRHVWQPAITQLQQAGLRRLLRTHWTQWQAALLRVRLEQWTQAQETDLKHWSKLASRGRLLLLLDTLAPWKQVPGGGSSAPPSSSGCSGLVTAAGPLAGCQWDQDAEGSAAPTPEPSKAKGRPLRGGQEVLMLLVIRRKDLQLEALLHRLQASWSARRLAVAWRLWVDAHGVEQLSQTLLKQWHLGQAWRMWRRRVLQLRVAQRLQQQDDGWVLSQAFEKWHQCLAARSQRRGATGSPSPLNRPGTRGPGSKLEAERSLGMAGLGQNKRPRCSCDLFSQNKEQN